MSNVTVNLDLAYPSDGPGSAFDTSGMGQTKTILVEGSFPGATITIQASNDGGVSWAPIATFQAAGKKNIDVAAQFLRTFLRFSRAGGGFSAEVSVSSPSVGGNFAAIPLPLSVGTSGTEIDVSTFGPFVTWIVDSFYGVVGIDVSDDGINWVEVATFSGGAGGGIQSAIISAERMRATSRGPGIPTSISVGAINDPSAAVIDVIAAPRTSFVYSPFSAAPFPEQNVYTDWATVVAAMATVFGPKNLVFESNAGPISLPEGDWDMTDVEWIGGKTNGLNSPPRIIVVLSNAITLPNLRKLTNIEVQITGLAAPAVSIADGETFTMNNGVVKWTSGIETFMTLSVENNSTKHFLNLFDSQILTGSFVGGNPLINLESDFFSIANVYIYLGNNSNISDNTFKSTGVNSPNISITSTSPSSYMSLDQPNLSAPPNYSIADTQIVQGTPMPLGGPFDPILLGATNTFDTTVAPATRTMPQASTVLPGAMTWIKKRAGGNALTISPFAGDTIDGSAVGPDIVSATGSLCLQRDVRNNNNWLILSSNL